MRLFFTTFCVAAFTTATSLAAQVFPDPTSTTVNDFANLLSPEAEARIAETLEDLEKDTGAEATIVTLSSIQFYANDMSVRDYATALFNAWGVGDAEKGDGVLLIVFRDNNQLRLTTGEGYDDAAKERAATVVSDVIIPEFRNDNFEAGIEKGATAIANDLVRNVSAQAPASPPSGEGGGNALWWILGVIGAAIAGLVGWGRVKAAKLAATPCPSCGKTELSKERVVLNEATLESAGNGEVRTICGACGHTTAEPFNISKKSPPKEDEPKFDGGKSDGGGASGKW